MTFIYLLMDKKVVKFQMSYFHLNQFGVSYTL